MRKYSAAIVDAKSGPLVIVIHCNYVLNLKSMIKHLIQKPF